MVLKLSHGLELFGWTSPHLRHNVHVLEQERQCFRGERPPFLEVLLFALPVLTFPTSDTMRHTGCGTEEMTAR